MGIIMGPNVSGMQKRSFVSRIMLKKVSKTKHSLSNGILKATDLFLLLFSFLSLCRICPYFSQTVV